MGSGRQSKIPRKSGMLCPSGGAHVTPSSKVTRDCRWGRKGSACADRQTEALTGSSLFAATTMTETMTDSARNWSWPRPHARCALLPNEECAGVEWFGTSRAFGGSVLYGPLKSPTSILCPFSIPPLPHPYRAPQ